MVQEVNRMFVERVEGFEVAGIAGSGAEGIKLVRELRPHLVFLDIFMPVLDGIETIRRLRSSDTPVDVIVVTAARDAETVRTMMRNGAMDYIIKPFKFERVRETLERFRLNREAFDMDQQLTQAELDLILHQKRAGAVQTLHLPDDPGALPGLSISQELLPKGLNALTLKQIILYMRKQNRLLSAEEVADGIGIARVTARRYLDYLEKQGHIVLDVHYGGIGRPVNRYGLLSDQNEQK
ncbi:response regulator [Paenibacillus alkalitolerans]|uniref:response regulator n=1 Tax=Paenibacillus alkalitolerans TaxID=2799335 RepID=UPI001F2E8BD8|nr:response regulator [Paenibacillus alkalitolerans]